MSAELDALGKALAHPARPLIAIVAGSKVSTKLTILATLAEKVQSLIVGGGIANTFLLAAGKADRKIARRARPRRRGEADRRNDRSAAPTDVVVGHSLDPEGGHRQASGSGSAGRDDSGHRSRGARAACRVARARGHHRVERPGRRVRERCVRQGHRDDCARDREIEGLHHRRGGDTVAAINKFGIAGEIDYISTAGGAFLEFWRARRFLRWPRWRARPTTSIPSAIVGTAAVPSSSTSTRAG